MESDQDGQDRAAYGEALIERLAKDLTKRFGRGFNQQNLQQMRSFYLAWSSNAIRQTVSGELVDISTASKLFPLPWSAYVRLLSVRNETARHFYEAEALRCGWSVRQLDRQINSQFYERIALSHNKAAMLQKAEQPAPTDIVTSEQALKDPFVLEFLNLKDEYSEPELALTHYTIKELGRQKLVLESGNPLEPTQGAGSGQVQDKHKEMLEAILRKVNDLFVGEISENDKLVYVNDVIKGKLLDCEILVRQAVNNTKEQFANSPDLDEQAGIGIGQNSVRTQGNFTGPRRIA